MWPRRMAKRKADIFTVIEYVDNWFEASSPIIALAEVPEGVVNRLEFGGTEQGPSRAVEPIANGETVSQPTLISSQSTGEVADCPEATHTGAEMAGAACPRV